MIIGIKHIKQKLKDGTIKSYSETKISGTVPGNNVLYGAGTIHAMIDGLLRTCCEEKGLELETEHRFDKKRKWRFDWAIPAQKIAIEYEGIFSHKSRHTTVIGYMGDVEKYNAATLQGWRIIRLTAKNYKTVVNILNELI